MNGSMSPGNCCHRSGTARGQSGRPGLCLALADWSAELRIQSRFVRSRKMLKVYRRIQRLERLSGVNDRIPLVHTITFVDSDGTVTGTLVLSHDWPKRANGEAATGAKGKSVV